MSTEKEKEGKKKIDPELQKHIDALKESEEKVGQLLPVIDSKYGVISGHKRLMANPNWRKKTLDLKSKYDYWKLVANFNIQKEPSKEECMEYVNGAIGALMDERKGITKAEIIAKLEKDSGLSRRKIYEFMDDEFKREYRKLTTDFGGEDESKSSNLEHSKSHKVVLSDLELEQLLILELQKAGVKPETKVPFDRPYNYTKPYFGDVKVGNIVMDISGKSSVEEVEERDEYFRKKGLVPIHFPGPIIKKYAPFVAFLVKSFMSLKYKGES